MLLYQKQAVTNRLRPHTAVTTGTESITPNQHKLSRDAQKTTQSTYIELIKITKALSSFQKKDLSSPNNLHKQELQNV